MNTQDFIQLLSSETSVKDIDATQLDVIIKSFPYFQTARMLQLKNLKMNGNFLFNSYLKSTAAYIEDRTVLFEYITEENIEEVSSINNEPIDNTEIIDLEEDINNDKEDEYDNEVKEEENVIIDDSTPKIIKFSSNDRFSFNEWLQLSNTKEINRETEDVVSLEKDKLDNNNSNFDLIEKFINTNPKLKPKPIEDITSGNIALSGTKENSGWMTETLAQVYIEQKKYSKAIKAYRILGLKYPEKSGFFADRIKSIERLSDN